MVGNSSYCVYKHTSPSGKIYIGITKQKPHKRWSRGNGYRTNEYFSRAIKKYGWDNFSHEIILDGLTEQEACEIEKELISRYRSTDERYGYNHSTGGDNTFSGARHDLREGKSPKARRICQFTKDGKFVREWSASTEIQRVLGFGYSNIIKCCTGISKFSNGYVWIYSEDVTPELVKNRCEKAKHRYNAPFTDEHRRHMSEGIRKHNLEKGA